MDQQDLYVEETDPQNADPLPRRRPVARHGRPARGDLGARPERSGDGRSEVHAARAGAARERRAQSRVRAPVGRRRARRRRLSRLVERDADEELEGVQRRAAEGVVHPVALARLRRRRGELRLHRRRADAHAQELGRAAARAGQGQQVRVGRIRAVRQAAEVAQRAGGLLQLVEQRRRAEDRARLFDPARLRVQRAVPLRPRPRGAEPEEEVQRLRHGAAAAGHAVAAGARARAAVEERHRDRPRGAGGAEAAARVELRARPRVGAGDDLRILGAQARAARLRAEGARSRRGRASGSTTCAASSPG